MRNDTVRRFAHDHDAEMADGGWRRSSCAAKGLWRVMLNLMPGGVPYGHLTDHDGSPMPVSILAMYATEKVRVVRHLLDELAQNGVYSVTPEGVIYCRRLVRLDHNAEARAVGGRLALRHHNVPRRKEPAEVAARRATARSLKSVIARAAVTQKDTL